MKVSIIASLVLLAATAEAQDIKVYATDKHGNKLRQTHVIKDAKNIYVTDKHGNILYHKPSIITR